MLYLSVWFLLHNILVNTRINILQWILTKLGTYLDLKRIWNPIDFQGQMSRSQGLIFKRGDMPRFALPLFLFILQSQNTQSNCPNHLKIAETSIIIIVSDSVLCAYTVTVSCRRWIWIGYQKKNCIFVSDCILLELYLSGIKSSSITSSENHVFHLKQKWSP
jgi:hypothetical protein